MPAHYPHIIQLHPAQLAMQPESRTSPPFTVHLNSAQKVARTPANINVEANDSMVRQAQAWLAGGGDPANTPAWFDPEIRVPLLPPESHYRFTGQTRVVGAHGADDPNGTRVWEIETTRRVSLMTGPEWATPHTLPEGTKGGWITSRNALDVVETEQGFAPWVGAGAVVTGRVRDQATVWGSTAVDSLSVVRGNATARSSNIDDSRLDGLAIVLRSELFKSNVNAGMVVDSTLANAEIDSRATGHRIHITDSELDWATVTGGHIANSYIRYTTVTGDARLRDDYLLESKVGYGYETGPITDNGGDRGRPSAPRTIEQSNQKYRLDPHDTITVQAHDGADVTLTRIVAERNLLPDDPEMAVRAGEKGGYVPDLDALSHADNAWVGRHAVVLHGLRHARIHGNARLIGGARMEGGEIGGEAKLIDSTTYDARIFDMARVEDSAVRHSEVVGGSTVKGSVITDSAINASTVLHSGVNDTVVMSSTLDRARISPDRDTHLSGNITGQIKDSELEDVGVTVDSEFGTRISESKLAHVDVDKVDLWLVNVQAEDDERLTISTKLPPRMAELYLATRAESEADTTPLFLNSLPHDASADTVRHILVAGLQAKDPDITRYMDTLALHDTDYGVIEPIVREPRLRAGMIDALRGMNALVVGGRYVTQNDPMTKTRHALSVLQHARYETKVGQMNEGLWPNVRIPVPLSGLPSEEMRNLDHLNALTRPSAEVPIIRIDGVETPVVPILLERHDLRIESSGWQHTKTDGKPVLNPAARGGRLYEPAFVDARSLDHGVENMRFLTVSSPSAGEANGIAFPTHEGAARYLDAVLAQAAGEQVTRNPNRRDHWSASQRVATAYSPILTGAAFARDAEAAKQEIKRIDLSGDFGAPLPEVALTFRAALPDHGPEASQVDLSFAAHDGHQAAIIRPVLGVGPDAHAAVLDPKSLDGAVATPSAALKVAQARAERGRGWTTENRPARVADLDPHAAPDAAPRAPRPGPSLSR